MVIFRYSQMERVCTCSHQRDKFKSLFGESVKVTTGLAINHASDFDFHGAIERFLFGQYRRNAKLNVKQLNAFLECVPDAADYIQNEAMALIWVAEYEKQWYLRDFKHDRFNFKNLRGLEAPRPDFSRSSLINADLSEVNLEEASFIGANLQHANLFGANLRGASFEWADLSWANLRGCNLDGVNFTGAKMEGVMRDE